MNIENRIDSLKTKPILTRQDIADLLKSIGKPGENQEEKIEIVSQLEKQNSQGIGLHESLNSYGEF